MSKRSNLQGRRSIVGGLHDRPNEFLPPVLENLEPRQLLSIPTSFTPVGYGGTGTAFWGMVNPANNNEIYASADMGQEWHTLDGGNTWATLSPLTQTTGHSGTSSVQYSQAGTFIIDQGVYPQALKKSTDNGTTWTIPSGWSALSGTWGAGQVLADPNSTKLVVLENTSLAGGKEYRIWFSSNGGQSFSKIAVASHEVQDGNNYVCYMAGAFWDGNNIYLATNFGLYTSTDGGTTWSASTIGGINPASEAIYSFTGSRSGATTRLYCITWPQSEFTSFYDMNALGYATPNFRGIYSVDVGQANWTNRTGTTWGASSAAKLYPRFVGMADNDIDHVWISGADSANYDTCIVYRADDGGVSGTWTRLLKTGYGSYASIDGAPNANIKTHQIGTGSPHYDWGYAGDTITFTLLRSNPQIMTFTNAGEMFMTTDGGAHWRSVMAPENQLYDYSQPTDGSKRFASTINETNTYNMIWADPQNIVAPCTDFTAIQSNDGGTSWLSPTYNIGTYANTYYDAVYDWRTGIYYAISSNKHDLYHDAYSDYIEGWGSDYVVASYDKGVTWNPIHDFSGSLSTVKAIALDPTRPDRLYIGLVNHTDGVGGIYYTDNLSAGKNSTWTRMANQPMRNGAFAGMHAEELKVLDNGDLVAVFAPRTHLSTDGSAWIADQDSGMWLLPGGNVTNSWVDRSGSLSGNGVLPNNRLPYWTMGMTVDPNDPTQNTWFATTVVTGTGWYSTAMYKSTDRGATWSRWGYVNNSTAPYNDPSMQVWKILIRPGTTEMFLGTALSGLYYCADYTAATPVFTQTSLPFGTLNFLNINPFNPDELWVATFGGGLFKANIGTTAQRPTAVTNVTATCTSGAFNVTWSDVSGETGYRLQYTDNSRSGANNDIVNWTTVTLPANTTSWSSSSISGNLPIYFRVMSVNASGVESAVSNYAAAANFPGVSNVAGRGMGGSQVLLTWTDNVVGEDSFEIQKSTDGVNWTSAGTASANATNASITGLATNTQYLFRVRGVSSTSIGNWSSPTVARTNSLAGLQAADDFTYPVGNLGTASSSGIGWSGAWIPGYYGDHAEAVISSGSLTAAGASTLWTSGNSLKYTLDDDPYRTTATKLGGSGTLWASYLLKVDYSSGATASGSITVGGVTFGVTGSNHFGYSDSVSVWADSGVTAVQGQTYFLVIKITSGTTDTVDFYLNPAPGAASPDVSTRILTRSTFQHLTGSNRISTGHGGYTCNPGIDEIRVGTSYTDVAPIALSAAPTNLSATAASAMQVNLSWTDNAGNEAGFHVERSTDGLNFTVVQTLSADTTSWNDTGLTTGTTYFYRVSSYNSTGDSVTTTVASATPGGAPAPTAPTSLTLGTVGQTTAAISWTDMSNNETGFKIDVATDSGFTNFVGGYNGFVVATTSQVGTNDVQSYTVTGLTSNTRYYIRLRATNTGGDSANCAAVNTYTLSNVPTALAANPVSTTQLNLAWLEVGTAATYNVYQSTDGATFTSLATGLTATSYSSTSLAAGTQYWYRVTAVNSAGVESAQSSMAVNWTNSNAPTSLAATAVSSSQINLAWSQSGGVASFKVYRAPDVGGAPGAFAYIAPSATASFSDTGLSSSTKYWYAVTAINGGGVETAYSNQSSATTQAVPSQLIAYDGFNYTGGQQLNGQGSAGNGWAGGWSVTGDVIANSIVLASSLTPPANLQTSGGAYQVGFGGQTAVRNVASNLSSYGTTVWASALIKVDVSTSPAGTRLGAFLIGNSQVGYSQEGDGSYRWEISSGNGTWWGSNWNSGQNPLAVDGQTYFVVIEEVFSGGSDTVYAWINPTPGTTAPTAGSAFETKSNVNAGGSLSVVKLFNAYYGNTKFDEVRLGATYADVAPVDTTPGLTAPSSLTATTSSTTQINLAWTDNATAETGFYIDRATDSGFSQNLTTFTASANSTSYGDTGLTQGTQYYYRVRAFNNTASSANSNTASAITQTTVTISATTPNAAEGGSNGVFTVTRVGTAGDLVVNLSAPTGTATSGSDYTALPTTVTIPSGSSSATVTVSVIDDSLNEPAETVIVSLASGSGYVVGSPSSDTVTIAASDLPTVTLSVRDASASETSSNTGQYRITRTGSTSGSLTVYYAMSGTASNTSGTDYTLSGTWGTAVIPSGSTRVDITLTPIDDSVVGEGTETAILTITTNANYTVGSPPSGTVNIADNDLPTVTVAAQDASASEIDPDAGTFRISRNGLTVNSLTVNYSLSGTASTTSGTDYTLSGTWGTATIPVGASYIDVTLTPVDDSIPESAETAVLTVSTNAAYTVGSPSNATVTIAASDSTVSITATDPNAAEPADTGTFTITRIANDNAAITVTYTIAGTAVGGTDYVSIPTSITMAAGELSKTITITPIDDDTVEPARTVTLTLTTSALCQYELGASTAATVTIADDDAIIDVSAPDASASEATLDGGTWRLTRGGNTSGSLTVTYSLGGIATAGSDYTTSPSGTSVTFGHGETTKDISLTPIQDYDTDQTARLTLVTTPGCHYSAGASNFADIQIAGSSIPGDANQSGLVDQDDYKIWYDNYGTGTTWDQGNFKGYGVTDQDDYKTWYDNYGKTSGGSELSQPTLALDVAAASPMLMTISQPKTVSQLSTTTSTTDTTAGKTSQPAANAAKTVASTTQTAARPATLLAVATSTDARHNRKLATRRVASIAGTIAANGDQTIDVLSLLGEKLR